MRLEHCIALGLGSYGFALSLLLHSIYAVPQLQANAYARLANLRLVMLPAAIASAVVLLVCGWRGRAALVLDR